MSTKHPLLITALSSILLSGFCGDAWGKISMGDFFKRLGSLHATKPAIPRFYSRLMHLLDSLETPPSALSIDSSGSDTALIIRAAIPRGKPLEWIIWRLSVEAGNCNHRVVECVVNDQNQTFSIHFESASGSARKIILESRPSQRWHSETARLAILIENFRFNSDKTTLDFLGFPEPLTFSLSASDSTSPWVSRAIEGKDKEIVIALGLEAHITARTPPGAIMVHYSEGAIHKIVEEATRAIVPYSGFVGREGSRALEDSRLMKIVLESVRRRNGYFIDAGGARNSVAPALARTLKVPFQTAAGYIGPLTRIEEVERQLMEYTATAQKRGAVLIRAEATPALINVLKNRLGYFRQNGIKLVYISSIVQHFP